MRLVILTFVLLKGDDLIMTCIKWSVLFSAIFLSACAGPKYFEPIQPASANEAVLYIYRPKADNPGMQPLRFSYPDVLIDDTSVGVLTFNHHRAVRLNPGKHKLLITGLTKDAKWEPKDIERNFSINPGEIKYIKLNVQFDLRKMNLAQPGAKFIINTSLKAPEDAIYEIRETDPE
jgi:hypothetical protein